MLNSFSDKDKPSDQVDKVIAEGFSRRVSDIHIEPHLGNYRILFRIDGVLHEEHQLDSETGQKIVSRLKVLSKIPVYIKDIPQDGRLLWKNDKTISHDLRVSVIPTIHGEKTVIRLFGEDQKALELEDLGFSEPLLNQFRDVLSRPSGTILLTGPAGCGKTTTIYAALRYIYKLRKQTLHIVTIEDPVECDLGFATQIQVKPQTGLGFPEVLRSVLRQDPEVIVVGEIRDKETGQIAISAGLTGHLVISTIHSGRACGVFTRLLELGIEPYILTSSLSGILAQRLVRKVCKPCAGKGCDACHQTGYYDRTAIGELLVMNPKLREILLTRPSTQVIDQLARELGMKTILEDGFTRLNQQITTKEELFRVIEKESLDDSMWSNIYSLKKG